MGAGRRGSEQEFNHGMGARAGGLDVILAVNDFDILSCPCWVAVLQGSGDSVAFGLALLVLLSFRSRWHDAGVLTSSLRSGACRSGRRAKVPTKREL